MRGIALAKTEILPNDPTELAIAYNNWGECLWRMERKTEALKRFRAARHYAERANDESLLLSILGNIAHACDTLGGDLLNEAITALQKIVDIQRLRYIDRPEQRHVALVSLFDVLYRKGNHQDGLAVAKELVRIEHAARPLDGAVAGLSMLGKVWRSLNQFDKACATYSVIWGRITSAPAFTDADFEFAREYADILHDAGQLREAAAIAEAAWAAAERHFAPKSRELALMFSALAQRKYALGAYAEAESLFKQTLACQHSLTAVDMITIYSNISKSYAADGKYIWSGKFLELARHLIDENDLWLQPCAIGYYDAKTAWLRAHKCFHEAVSACQAAIALREKHSPAQKGRMTNTLNLLGGLLKDAGDPQQALDAYRRALAAAEGSRTLRILTLHNIGAIYTVLGDDLQAKEYYRQALRLKRKIFGEQHPSVAATLINLGAIAARRNDHAKALRLADEALEIERCAFGATHREALRTRMVRAGFLNMLQRRDEARIELEAVLDAQRRLIAELMSIRQETPQRRILEDILTDFDSYIDAVVKNSVIDPNDAQAAYAHVLFRKGILTDALIVADTSATGPEVVAEYINRKFSILEKIKPAEMLLDYIEWRTPETEKRNLGVFMVSQHKGVSFHILGEIAQIEAQIAEFLQAVVADNEAEIRRLGGVLNAALIPGGLERLHACDSVIVSPDAALCQLPFAALPYGDRRLGLAKRISYASSGRDLARAVQAQATGAPIVFAAPAFGLSLSGPNFRPLAGALEEGRIVSRLLNAQLFTCGEADFISFSRMYRPQIIHIATHGVPLAAEEDGRQLWCLALAGASLNPRPGKGLVSTADIAKQDLRGTELVTLSACRTAIGPIHRFDNMDGLRRAFHIAGVQFVLSSLLPTPDCETGPFMSAFYQNYIKSRSAEIALYEAQIEVEANKRPAREWSIWTMYR